MKFYTAIRAHAMLSAGLLALTTFVGCAGLQPLPAPGTIVSPQPILGNSGKYHAPYTQDEVLAPWVTKAINTGNAANLGGAVGAAAGSYLLDQAVGSIPFVGAFVGNAVGSSVARKAAVDAAGGETYIKSTSDQSFNHIDKLAVWMYANYGTTEHYPDAFKAASGIYPELQERNHSAILQAAKKVALN